VKDSANDFAHLLEHLLLYSRATAGDREQVPKARHAASTTRRRNMVAAIRSVREWGAARQFWPGSGELLMNLEWRWCNFVLSDDLKKILKMYHTVKRSTRIVKYSGVRWKVMQNFDSL